MSMSTRYVNMRVEISGIVPVVFATRMFENAVNMTPEDGILTFTIDGADEYQYTEEPE